MQSAFVSSHSGPRYGQDRTHARIQTIQCTFAFASQVAVVIVAMKENIYKKHWQSSFRQRFRVQSHVKLWSSIGTTSKITWLYVMSFTCVEESRTTLLICSHSIGRHGLACIQDEISLIPCTFENISENGKMSKFKCFKDPVIKHINEEKIEWCIQNLLVV